MSYYLSNYSLLIDASDSQICSLMIMQQNAQSRMYSSFSSSSRSECTHTHIHTFSLTLTFSWHKSFFCLTLIHTFASLTHSLSLSHTCLCTHTHTRTEHAWLQTGRQWLQPQAPVVHAASVHVEVNDLLWGVNKQMEMPAIFHNQPLTRKLWDTLFLL